MNFRPVKPRAYGTTAELVGRLIDDCGGVKRAAHILGKSATQLYAYSDPQEAAEISFDDVRRLIEASLSRAPAEDLAALACGFVTWAVPCEDPLGKLMARVEKDNGAAIGLILARLDKHGRALRPDPVEQGELLRDIDAMMRGLAAARLKVAGGAA